MRKIIPSAVLAVLLLALAACNSGGKPVQTSGKPEAAQSQTQSSEYLTGRSAFQKLFVSARSFATDIKPYRLESVYTEGSPADQGKAGIWRAQFASPSKRAIKAYTWSGIGGPDAPDRGVSHGTEDTYNPSNRSTHVFDLPFLKIDTDKAFEVAQAHGGDKLTKKNPKQPVTFLLDFDAAANQLIWHVIYGTGINDAKLRVAVDASTGAYIRTEH